MKKGLLYTVIIALLAAGGIALYRTIVPKMVARAVVSDSLPDYIPKRIQRRIESIRKPLNRGTEAVVREMKARDIPVKELVEAIDNTSEEEFNRALDELEARQPRTSDEVFDILKDHLRTDFNPEILREPFTSHVSMKQVDRIVTYAEGNRKTHDVDFNTAKAILKQLILEKRKEFAQGSAE